MLRARSPEPGWRPRLLGRQGRLPIWRRERLVAALRGFELQETALANIELGLPVLQAPLAGSREAGQEAIEHGGLGLDSMTWDASDAPEAARERCGCQLAGAHSALDTKLFASQMDTSNNAKTSNMSRQRLSGCCTVRVHQQL